MRRGTISVALLHPVWEALPKEARRDFLGATDLDPSTLADRDARVSPAQLCVAWSELVRVTRTPAIALAIADATPVGAFGVVEYLCRSQQTLGDALRQWVRFLNLLDDAVVVGLVDEGAHASVRVLAESEAPAPASHELCFALIVTQAREISRTPFAAVSVDLIHPAPTDPAIYERWFDAPVRFGAKHTQLVLDRALLDSPLTTADPSLTPVLEGHAAARQAAFEDESNLLGELRRAMRVGLQNDDAGIDAIARRIGVTPRSLQRKLKEDGTSFSGLREEVRRELADRYLGQGLSISEVSFLLGFSEPSAFFRAFKRWTGRTPTEHRARLATT